MKKCKYPEEICGLATVVKGVSYCNSVPCSLKDDIKTVGSWIWLWRMSDGEIN